MGVTIFWMNQSIMKTQKFPPLAVVLHWLFAALIIWGIFSGFYASFGKPSPAVFNWISFINVSATALFTPLFFFRVFYRMTFRAPPLTELSVPNVVVAKGVQVLIYSMALVSFVSGWLMMSRPVNVFNLIHIPQPLHDPRVLAMWVSIHFYSNALLAGFVFLHVAGVLKHQVMGKRILQRMAF
ncbi:hypothetical protein PATSB16_03560 [Pandoraea thiooxydans]|uniref:Cytochrome b561 bacterial/Ni-hydrogenase domain-containing protein n=3 Tax=Pandoraea thiooxydans TaxID=445709 RepID=A0A0G3F130_9BURK|nr:hypothetical protein PATSB16_03560 [Pandoraea thiooxydans]